MLRKTYKKHPVPSITATMEEMPERHTWTGQIMVSLDILCVSIDLRVYFLCPVIIQFHPLPPQWRGCQKGTREASSSIHYRHNGGDAWKAQSVWSQSILLIQFQFHPLPPQWRRCQKGTREASSSIHYRHNGGDARKAHVGRSNYGESRYFVCFHRSQSILLMSCYHPVPSITATMEEMPERHTWSIQFHPYTATMEEMPERHTWSIQFHPLPLQWRRCQKGTREGRSNYGESRYFVCFLSISEYTSDVIQFHPLTPQWRRCQKGTREASSSIHYRHNGGDARKAHVKHPVPSITATMEEMPERNTWAGQIMVSLDILCVSIDLRVYFLCPVIIQFHPLPPQWRRCQKGTREASSIQFHPVIPPQWRRCQKGTRGPVKLWWV